MISKKQVQILAKEQQISEYVILREYIQILFLKDLYEQSFAKDIFFRGGTAIRLLYGGQRFSEDLDFTVSMDEDVFVKNVSKLFSILEKQYQIRIKERKTMTGKAYLLTATTSILSAPVYVSLDFSMREDVKQPKKNILKTNFPVVLQNYVYSLSKDEIFAEKIRAFMEREKSRDLYDLWILQELGAQMNLELVKEKFAYYGEDFSASSLVERLDVFKKGDFEKDLKQFLPINERIKLGKLFDYIQEYLKKTFSALSS
jgi:predicted nucleotidyltransferase component of viral defense system